MGSANCAWIGIQGCEDVVMAASSEMCSRTDQCYLTLGKHMPLGYWATLLLGKKMLSCSVCQSADVSKISLLKTLFLLAFLFRSLEVIIVSVSLDIGSKVMLCLCLSS